MSWNFHHYYTNRKDGLIGQLLLDENEEKALKNLRQKVRVRIRDIFEEARNLVNQTKKMITLESLKTEVARTQFQHLSLEDQENFAQLIYQLSDDAKAEFLKLTPRFWTQGSFTYDTLNRPYVTPPQEMDIDDGTYLPMVFFDEKPMIGHQLLLLLVDTSLKSLVAENSKWEYEEKRTCGRIKVPHMNTHIDVPMYAIPRDKFLEKEIVLKESATARLSFDAYDSSIADHKKYSLDSNCVNLAIRADEEKWMKSDPKVVYDWFSQSCSRIGPHLRKICRFLKAWRDAQWQQGGGPSSISLMAATVTILDNIYVDQKNFGEVMKTVAKHLPQTFRDGVESPDRSDERLLFPHLNDHTYKEHSVINMMEELAKSLERACTVTTKQDALTILNSCFGTRVTDPNIIISEKADPAFQSQAQQAQKPFKISSTMSSGCNE